ncbi:MAG TPA: ABC transporter permease [Novosphingobium sp.]|nr:ABC transporter permease [Novosphingobium sp.]
MSRRTGRLSIAAAAWVVARRDFVAILFSRAFLFFLLGPLFPVVVGLLAGSVAERVQLTTEEPALGILMRKAEAEAVVQARGRLAASLGYLVPRVVVLQHPGPGEASDPRAMLGRNSGVVTAILSGTPQRPVLTGPRQQIEKWRAPVALIAGEAASGRKLALPEVSLATTAAGTAVDRNDRLKTAQGAQTLLFLLTMMLAGMVLSNLVEEKGNKIIEVLAAAIPMDSVFFGKLFAMLGVSFVGITVWGTVGLGFWLAAGTAVPRIPEPAVGWPMLFALGVGYFAMAYLLLGSLFLSIGSMATTVREVQTLSMPVTMMQLLVFFFASIAMTQPGSALEFAAVLFPLSSPFAMLARAALEPELTPHLLAFAWQALWVLLLVRFGARLFRTRVMKAGPGKSKRGLRALLSRG